MIEASPPVPRWTTAHSVGSLIAVSGVPLAGLALGRGDREWCWIATMASLAASALIAGHGITGSWRGVIIDTRNKISLSRLQALLWTILLLSSVSTAAFANIAARKASPLAIAVPQAVWLLAGIGTTSLAAAPLIQGAKSARPADPEQAARTLGILSLRRGGVNPAATLACRGQVVVNVLPGDASWSDLIAGEEVGNAPYLDLGKIQMLYATLVLLVVYAAALSALFRGAGPAIDSLPAIDGGLVALLGVSHAGYIAIKATPQSLPG